MKLHACILLRRHAWPQQFPNLAAIGMTAWMMMSFTPASADNPDPNYAYHDEPRVVDVIVHNAVDIGGRVTGTDGEPLAGVSVRLEGTNTGTTTDAEGRYALAAADGSGTLIFSYVGYVSQEIAINGRSTIDVQLVADANALSEVVVTALGITRDKKVLAYSITEVGGEGFTKARENNLGNALSGKIAGVNASSTATGPGGASRVIIRGNGSLAGDNQPLYVVNGVPINNSHQGAETGGDGLVSINPDDIESISVLKGGTAAALYGSRAANGVILITTKSGNIQKGIGVELNSTTTVSSPLVIPDWQYEYGSGTRGEKPVTQGDAVANGRTSWGARLDGSPVIQFDGVNRPYSAQRDNARNFYDNGLNLSNTLSLSGGNEIAQFRFSASNMHDAGIVPKSAMERNAFNLSVNANLSDKILFEGRAQYNIETAKNRTSIADFTDNPNSSVGLMATSIDVRTLDPGYDERGYEVPWNDYIFVTNPYFAVNKVKNEDERRRFIGTFNVRYNMAEFLYARARVGIDYFNIAGWEIGPTGRLTNLFGNYSTDRNTTYETNIEGILGFDKSFGSFSVNAIAGGNKMYNQNAFGGLSSGNLNVPFQYFISNGSSQTFSDGFGASAINSLFGSVDIGFKDYLYLSLTGRQDWFSTLSPESNSLFYPSAGLSFIFSDIWDAKPSWLSYGKIRASWAQVGGDAPSPYGLDLTYSTGQENLAGQPLMRISGNTIPNALRPYTSTTTEAGLEVRALNNRLGADITLYRKVTTDDIVRASVPSTSGYSNVSLNVGEMRNQGVELLLTGTPVQSTAGFRWDVSYNMAYNQNTVVKIADGLTSLTGGAARTDNARINHYEGSPYGMVSGFRARRDEQGNIMYNSANGIPLQGEFEALGRGVPPWTMGLSNTLTYKNFSLDVLLDGKFGSMMYVSTNAYGTYYGLDKRTVADGVRESGVSVAGVDQDGQPYNAVIPAQNYFQGIAFSLTDQFIADASFVKVRQLVFGYSLPQSLLTKTPFQSVAISFVARNLWLLYSNVANVDPEATYGTTGGTYGLEMFGVPPTRNFGFNLAVRL
ncbi:SusC/RagA family TonB-linked outer membrane protein [Parapedobacter lycopersici]|uniref:SusC/RagA family TonB-linked outer membrane protein n=1 Tax=Parapedobacter lycopersici TaxID=1864939 RepID=UPI00333E31BD